MFLLVPAHPGSPEQRAIKWLLLLLLLLLQVLSTPQYLTWATVWPVATVDLRQKLGAVPLLGGELGPHVTQCGLG